MTAPLLLPPAPPRRDVREAVTLPFVFLTVAFLGGFRVALDGRLQFLPPPLMALVLGVLLMGLLVRAGALDPLALANPGRTPLENASGFAVIAALFAASAQIFHLLTPERGLLAFIATAFFLLLLWTTLAAAPDRPRLLRSLVVVFGGMFVLKYVVLAAVFQPQPGLLKRVMLAMLEGASLGTLEHTPHAAATGYVAFATIVLYAVGLVLLPGRRTEAIVRGPG